MDVRQMSRDDISKMCKEVLDTLKSFEFYNNFKIQNFVIVRNGEGDVEEVQAIAFATSKEVKS